LNQFCHDVDGVSFKGLGAGFRGGVLLYGLPAYFIIKKLLELTARFFDYTDFEI
jgi:hypothetical protein